MATNKLMEIFTLLHSYAKLQKPMYHVSVAYAIYRCGGRPTSRCVGERALDFGFISARRLTLLTPLLRHLQLPIVCIRLRLPVVCVRAESATDLSLISRYSINIRGRSRSTQNHLYVIGLNTSQDATTKP